MQTWGKPHDVIKVYLLFSIQCPASHFFSTVLLIPVLALFLLSKHVPEVFSLFLKSLPAMALSCIWSKSVHNLIINIYLLTQGPGIKL